MVPMELSEEVIGGIYEEKKKKFKPQITATELKTAKCIQKFGSPGTVKLLVIKPCHRSFSSLAYIVQIY